MYMALEKKSIELNLKDLEKFADGTYVLFAHFLHQSKVHFIDQITAVYRYLPESASHSGSFEKLYEREKNLMVTDQYLLEKFNKQAFQNTLKNSYSERFLKIFDTDKEKRTAIINDLWLKQDEVLINFFHFVLDKYTLTQEENSILKSKLSKIHKSKTFKIGSFILSPIRKFIKY